MGHEVPGKDADGHVTREGVNDIESHYSGEHVNTMRKKALLAKQGQTAESPEATTDELPRILRGPALPVSKMMQGEMDSSEREDQLHLRVVGQDDTSAVYRT